MEKAKLLLLTIINNKKKKKIKSNVQSSLGNFPCGIDGRNMPFELKWLQVFSSMAKTIVVTRNTGSKGKRKAVRSRLCGHHLTKHLPTM